MARVMLPRRGEEVRAAIQGFEVGLVEGFTVCFAVLGEIPRKAPYKKGFRGRLYVPDDVRAWRAHIAKNFLHAGGRRPRKGEQPDAYFYYTMVRNHSDLDSISHSALDALTKDALHCADKEWWMRAARLGVARYHGEERTAIKVVYRTKGPV